MASHPMAARSTLLPAWCWRALAAGLLGAVLQQPASAAVTITGPASVAQGEAVSFFISDDALLNFEFADLLVQFDPDALSLVGASSTALTAGFDVLAGTPQDAAGGLKSSWISLITGGSPISGGGEIVELRFVVRVDAPLGAQSLALSAADPSAYDFLATGTRFDITSGGTLPAAPTVALLALALLLMHRRLRPSTG